MKSKFRGVLASLLLGGILMSACAGTTNTESNASQDTSSHIPSESETSTPTAGSENLFLGCPVFYDCGAAISGDRYLNALTDGDDTTAVTLKAALKDAKGNDRKLTFTDWYGGSHEEVLDGSSVDFSIDLGFMTDIDTLKLKFNEYNGKPIKVFASTDGYNFSFYLGEFDGYDEASGEWTAAVGGFNAKAVLFVLPIEAKESIVISSAEAYGSREHDRTLLSLGASYTWNGSESSIYAESGNKLTDGETARPNDTAAVVGKTSSEADPLTGKKGSVITLDLGSGKNVSEVAFGAYITSSGTGSAADRIDVRFSEDGESWDDFGQSHIRTAAAARGASKRYLVTRNHTVKARYIRIYTYTEALFLCDEISVYGSDTPVAEPDYGYKRRPQYFASNTNVASYQSATLNGKDCPALTDNIHSVGTSLADGENTVVIKLKNPATVAGITLVTNGEISGITAYGDAELIGTSLEMTAAGEYVYYLIAENPKKALDSVTIKFRSSKGTSIAEAEVYAAAPQLPYVRGGFFQLPTSGGANPSSQNSDYSWYLHLKGMRDLGMEYVVIQYSTHFNAKTTLINGKRITSAGYTYNPTYGSADLCKAVLDAAEKLGMKVWLGTVHDSDFTNPTANTAQYEAIVSDSYKIIDDINELYGSHPAFGGYYLSDETCDAWLNLTGGVDAARYVYKNQSDHIRKIAPEAMIMIAPAIWRSGDPEKGADNLYRMIMPETEGGRPVVDILAAQDCLGREQTLAVSDEAYKSYLTYVEQWAKAVRRAGAEFWHDAEVFEITSTQKRHDDLMKTLTLEAPLSGSIIVFDIPHYFSTFPMGSYNNEYDYFKRLKMREYAEYYSTVSSLVDNTFDAVHEDVYENDGKTVDTSGVKPVTPPVTDTKYNEGVIVTGKPGNDIAWQSFTIANGSGKKPEFALYCDSDAFYVLLKTNDATADYGNGAWWEGKNDLVQLWIAGDGSAAADVLTSAHGVRYYIDRTGESTFTSGGESGANATFAGFTYAYDNGIFTVKMPWNALGRTAPAENDGTAIGVLIQYVDGSDASWSASTGNKGRSITSAERYSF